MSTTGLSQFDDTLHKTNLWLKEIMVACDWDNRQTAYRALRVTLHTIRDHLPLEIMAHLSAQLPILVRGILFEGWKPNAAAHTSRDLDDFLKPIQDAFGYDINADPEAIARNVFQVIAQHVTEGEIRHIQQALPKHVREAIKLD